MNRELSFRVWDKQTKKMSPPFALFGEFTLLGAIHNWQAENGNKSNSSLEALSDLIEMQYTGLKDKNGKKIYEGDIYKLPDSPYLYRVGFNYGAFTGYLFDESNGSPLGWGRAKEDTSWVSTIEVIGNIYENPTLCSSNPE